MVMEKRNGAQKRTKERSDANIVAPAVGKNTC